MPTAYRIHKIAPQKRGSRGITKPAACTLHGILKFDCEESPHLVYNEYVATRLAQMLRIPVADGVLTVAGDGLAYASLEVALPGLDLPNMRVSQHEAVVKRYPSQAAAILAFDYWIGNVDRGANVKASLKSPHVPLFRAFDHHFCLLSVEQEAEASIERLESMDPVLQGHPFQPWVAQGEFNRWVGRISSAQEELIRECCVFRSDFRSVTLSIQERLCHALRLRAIQLAKIVPTPINLLDSFAW